MKRTVIKYFFIGYFDSSKSMSKEVERTLEKVRDTRDDFEMEIQGAPEMMGGDTENVGESDVDNLEEEIKKGERMMEDFDR